VLCGVDVQPVSTSAEFSSSGGFIELPQSVFAHSDDGEEMVEMTVITAQPDGLLLWQSQTASEESPASTSDKDFIAVVLSNGRVQFRCFCSFACCNASNCAVYLATAAVTSTFIHATLC